MAQLTTRQIVDATCSDLDKVYLDDEGSGFAEARLDDATGVLTITFTPFDDQPQLDESTATFVELEKVLDLVCTIDREYHDAELGGWNRAVLRSLVLELLGS